MLGKNIVELCICKYCNIVLLFYLWGNVTSTDLFVENFIKGAWPDHFFDHPTYLNFFEILVPIDGSYFSHSYPEIWHPESGYL